MSVLVAGVTDTDTWEALLSTLPKLESDLREAVESGTAPTYPGAPTTTQQSYTPGSASDSEAINAITTLFSPCGETTRSSVPSSSSNVSQGWRMAELGNVGYLMPLRTCPL